MTYDKPLVDRILAEARSMVDDELGRLLAQNRATSYGPLYDLVADYPFREGKGLRPGICLAAARAAGGRADQVQTSAAAVELMHNGFLVHDDVEDDSDFRRGGATMLRDLGAPIAVNVGDATIVLALQMLLANTSRIGVRKSLLVLQEVERAARESVEGQAIELEWIRLGLLDLDDAAYVRMAHKKTCWYTVVAPLRIGVICGFDAGVDFPLEAELLPLVELGHLAGIAFQICDDLLNLEADESVYGKESNGDLWEGKRTVMLLHFLRRADRAARQRAEALLQTPRTAKDPIEVTWLRQAMEEAGSLEHGRRLAQHYSERALEVDAGPFAYFGENEDRRFLREVLHYVVERIK